MRSKSPLRNITEGNLTALSPRHYGIGMKTTLVSLMLMIMMGLVAGPGMEIKPTGHTPKGFNKIFTKKVEVFGIPIFATTRTSDKKLRHASNILAGYLDNDGNGIPDNKLVVQAIKENKGAMVMFDTEKEAEKTDVHRFIPEEIWDAMIIVALYGEETRPGGNLRGEFDGSLEEILHLITSAGYAKAYPEIFGEKPGTEIAKAMDKARGGHFRRVPKVYPGNAWYTYYDRTCDYSCQITEYIYWGLTSILGIQNYPGRREEIIDEWRLNTADKMRIGDPDLYGLLTNPIYSFPTKRPTGRYETQK